MKNVFIAGCYALPLGKYENVNSLELTGKVVKGALEDAKFPKEKVEGLFLTPLSFSLKPIRMRAQRLSEYLGLANYFTGEVECGGTTGMLALKLAANEIALGRINSALVVAVEIEKYKRKDPDELGFLLSMVNSFYSPYDSPYGLLAATPYYAMSAQQYLYQNNLTEKDITYLPVLLRENASKNPLSQFKDKITEEDVLNSRVIVAPLKLLESCPLSDGACALLLVNEDLIKDLKAPQILIKSFGEYHHNSHFFAGYGDITDYLPVKKAAQIALSSAEIKLSDVDIAEIYGAFSTAEYITYEAIGFFEKGKAPLAVKEGKTQIDGEIPINTSGGRLSLGHPPFVTPLLEVMEIVLQLQQKANKRQVKNVRLGLAQAEHGAVNGSMITILERKD